MKKQICLIILIVTCRICNAQNLVPNGDFEQYSGCPDLYCCSYDSLLFWINPTYGWPHYYNQCSSVMNVPNALWGYQPAHSGGGFVQIRIYHQAQSELNVRAYIQVGLLTPLISNICYHFEMYVNHPNDCRYVTDDIGVYFSDTAISQNNNLNFSFAPQIVNTSGIIQDTLNWTLVNGDYIAAGGESFITIGNFLDDANTTIVSPWLAPDNSINYYIDDVSLNPCVTAINEQIKGEEVSIYPDPTTGDFIITFSRIIMKGNIELLNILGETVFTENIFNQSKKEITLKNVYPGIYFVKVYNGEKQFCKKIIIE